MSEASKKMPDNARSRFFDLEEQAAYVIKSTSREVVNNAADAAMALGEEGEKRCHMLDAIDETVLIERYMIYLL